MSYNDCICEDENGLMINVQDREDYLQLLLEQESDQPTQLPPLEEFNDDLPW